MGRVRETESSFLIVPRAINQRSQRRGKHFAQPPAHVYARRVPRAGTLSQVDRSPEWTLAAVSTIGIVGVPWRHHHLLCPPPPVQDSPSVSKGPSWLLRV